MSETYDELIARMEEEGPETVEIVMEQLVKLITPICIHCHRSGEIVVPLSQFEAYQGGAHVQVAFPTMSVDKREQIITGTHPECWDAMFGTEE